MTNRRNKLPRNLYPEKRGQNKRNVVVSNAHRVRHYANAGDCVNLPNDIDLHFSSPLFPLSSFRTDLSVLIKFDLREFIGKKKYKSKPSFMNFVCVKTSAKETKKARVWKNVVKSVPFPGICEVEIK